MDFVHNKKVFFFSIKKYKVNSIVQILTDTFFLCHGSETTTQ